MASPSSDAGLYSFPRDCRLLFDRHSIADVNVEDQATQEHEYSSYDEFCIRLRNCTGIAELNEADGCSQELPTTLKPKKFSYVSNWRTKVDASNLTIIIPPSPLFHSFDSPPSPAASIDPSRLCVTSIPPSEYENYSPLSTGHSKSLCEVDPKLIGESFQEFYDTHFARMLDEASEVESPSSFSISPEAQPVVLPEVYTLHPQVHKNLKKRPLFRNVSSTIRWLPTRIKYSILSRTTQRTSRR
ncbi:hypothetical protein J3R30DRAFT_3400838 [Lentinula aciculospora]|uniref:Uncharacterized protein n=1 Tax=Lentinula aciculospora TaxID=153920 RepID=A0A9W9ATL5_9AGAR|nr:hypothetical protein J3R30DRAFT_3400838 [Lentinula aciculospora]